MDIVIEYFSQDFRRAAKERESGKTGKSIFSFNHDFRDLGEAAVKNQNSELDLSWNTHLM